MRKWSEAAFNVNGPFNFRSLCGLRRFAEMQAYGSKVSRETAVSGGWMRGLYAAQDDTGGRCIAV